MLYHWLITTATLLLSNQSVNGGLIFSNFTIDDLVVKNLINWSQIENLKRTSSEEDYWINNDYEDKAEDLGSDTIDKSRIIAPYTDNYKSINEEETDIDQDSQYAHHALDSTAVEKSQLTIQIIICVMVGLTIIGISIFVGVMCYKTKQDEYIIQTTTEEYINSWKHLNQIATPDGSNVYVAPKPGPEDYAPMSSSLPEDTAAKLTLEKMHFDWSNSI